MPTTKLTIRLLFTEAAALRLPGTNLRHPSFDEDTRLCFPRRHTSRRDTKRRKRPPHCRSPSRSPPRRAPTHRRRSLSSSHSSPRSVSSPHMASTLRTSGVGVLSLRVESLHLRRWPKDIPIVGCAPGLYAGVNFDRLAPIEARPEAPACPALGWSPRQRVEDPHGVETFIITSHASLRPPHLGKEA